MDREIEPMSPEAIRWASRFRRVDIPGVTGMSGFEQCDDEGHVKGRVWVRRSRLEGNDVAPQDTGPVRPMLLPGVEVSVVEAAKYDNATPQEEADFQRDIERIREAERQAAIEGRRIILGGSSSE